MLSLSYTITHLNVFPFINFAGTEMEGYINFYIGSTGALFVSAVAGAVALALYYITRYVQQIVFSKFYELRFETKF